MTWTEIHKIDQLLTLEINSWNSFITDPMWQFFSDKLVWAPMYAAIIALLIWKLGWKRGLMILAAALLTFGFCDQFSNLIKHAVGRIRPLHDDFMVAQGLHILEPRGFRNRYSESCRTVRGSRQDLIRITSELRTENLGSVGCAGSARYSIHEC